VAKISIVIPVYNEVNNIAEVLRRIAALETDAEKEVVIVDDGSTDGTERILADVERTDLVKIHMSPANTGKGFAVRVGLGYTTGDVVLIQDADLEYEVSDIPRIVGPILRGEADVVYGSRFLGDIQRMAFPNRVANKILTWTVRILYRADITDEATAYKAFRRDLIAAIPLDSNGFEICPEMTAKVLRRGHTIHEVPISYSARGVSEGKKIGWKDGYRAMWALLRYRVG